MTSQDSHHGERRQHVRIRRNYIIRFSDKNNPSVKFEISQIENISKGGLCFTSTIPFIEKSDLLVELRTPYIFDTIHLEGQVLESKEKVKGLIFENRLQFHDVTPQAADILDKIEKFNASQR
ncbi:MAG: PilZ domain-containing protein [Candidatus Omnitrophica bacterium]|nr:PilZ domain-containing protein [Candidatus Omnitrophota bacterium]